MDWPIGSVKIQAIKWRVCNDPISDFAHVFIDDKEVARGATTFANQLSASAAFIPSVLIQLWSNTFGNVPPELG